MASTAASAAARSCSAPTPSTTPAPAGRASGCRWRPIACARTWTARTACAHRSHLRALRCASRARVRRWTAAFGAALLHQLGVARVSSAARSLELSAAARRGAADRRPGRARSRRCSRIRAGAARARRGFARGLPSASAARRHACTTKSCIRWRAPVRSAACRRCASIFAASARARAATMRAGARPQDALAVIALGRARWPDAPLTLAGFSFGAMVALLRRAHAAHPVRLIRWRRRSRGAQFAAVARPACPWLIVQGDADELVDCARCRPLRRASQPPPQLRLLPGVDHFFHGRLHELRDAQSLGVPATQRPITARRSPSRSLAALPGFLADADQCEPSGRSVHAST